MELHLPAHSLTCLSFVKSFAMQPIGIPTSSQNVPLTTTVDKEVHHAASRVTDGTSKGSSSKRPRWMPGEKSWASKLLKSVPKAITSAIHPKDWFARSRNERDILEITDYAPHLQLPPPKKEKEKKNTHAISEGNEHNQIASAEQLEQPLAPMCRNDSSAGSDPVGQATVAESSEITKLEDWPLRATVGVPLEAPQPSRAEMSWLDDSSSVRSASIMTATSGRENMAPFAGSGPGGAPTELLASGRRSPSAHLRSEESMKPEQEQTDRIASTLATLEQRKRLRPEGTPASEADAILVRANLEMARRLQDWELRS